MLREARTLIRSYRSSILCATACCVGAASLAVIASETEPKKPVPGVIFSAPLPDVPGKQLVVVDLKFPPTTEQRRGHGHRHPGSVYVYVTRGTLRLGIESQPVQEVRTGQSFFEPPGALHTVAESASSTEPASAIAVMIVPEGAPLVIVDGDKK